MTEKEQSMQGYRREIRRKGEIDRLKDRKREKGESERDIYREGR